MATLTADESWRPRIKGKCVVYLRTSERPHSRLNIKAQRAAVVALLSGFPARPIRVFVEIEPLVAGARPALEQAVAACKDRNASLIIGKLDRMRSQVDWLELIHAQGIRVFAADIPDFCRYEFWKLYNERQSWRFGMGESVREGLARAKADGASLGGLRGDPKNLKKGPAASAIVRRAEAISRNRWAWGEIKLLQHRGITTMTGIATRLNQMGLPAPRGGQWSPTQVSRMIKLFEG